MASTGLNGPYELTDAMIDKYVGSSIGAYALGSLNANGGLTVSYVGRSDSDLNARLKQWVGKKYKHFRYGHFTTMKAAFEKECQMFHDFGGVGQLDNDIHPAKPAGTSYKCPKCGS